MPKLRAYPTTISLAEGGIGALAYSDALATYLAFAVDRGAITWATLSLWNNIGEKVEHVFGRQTLSMTGIMLKATHSSNSTGNWLSAVEWVRKRWLGPHVAVPALLYR